MITVAGIERRRQLAHRAEHVDQELEMVPARRDREFVNEAVDREYDGVRAGRAPGADRCIEARAALDELEIGNELCRDVRGPAAAAQNLAVLRRAEQRVVA